MKGNDDYGGQKEKSPKKNVREAIFGKKMANIFPELTF